MIIVEGLDRCGKSTVTKALLRLLPTWSYRHHTKPPMAPYGYFAGFIADARPHVIVDRMHWSEPAYGKTFRGESGLTRIDYLKLDLMCLAQDAKTLYMEDDVESIRARWDDKEMFPESGIESLKREYEAIIAGSPLPYIRARLPELVSDDGRPTEALARLAALADEEANQTLMAPPPSIGAGRLKDAAFFVIGPTPTLQGAEKDPDVQFPLPLGHAEEAFWECMMDGLPWNRGYYTSASSYSTAALKRLILTPIENDKDRPVVICLGREAEDAAKRALGPWPIVSMDHPSHGLRTGALDKWCAEFRTAISHIEVRTR